MPVKSYNEDNYEPGSTPSQYIVSGKTRDYYTSKSGPGFIGTIINPTGITTEPGNGYRYHVYLSPATVSVVGNNLEIDYLVVAGGGGGGGRSPTPSGYGSAGQSGGGGAGGMLNGTTIIESGTYQIYVGSGGNGGSGPSITSSRGSNGSLSGLGTITTTGGGGGGAYYWSPNPGLGPPLLLCAGRSGGSGGGGGGVPAPVVPAYPGSFIGGAGNTPPTTPPQGNDGGSGSGGAIGAGGGGGAGGSGASYLGTPGVGRTDIRFAAPLIAPAIPAPLRPTWITTVGDLGTYASGGAGGGDPTAGANNGHEYTGNGGQGVYPSASPFLGVNGGNGGSGIVVFRYLI